MRPLSLRGRVWLGAIFWTAGLFTLGGAALNVIMTLHPRAPMLLHGFFGMPVVIVGAVGSMLLGFVHVRRGLSGVDEVRKRLTALHEGRETRIAGLFPDEIQPLVSDLNALLDHRERAIQRAMTKAGDLAHGLKTPLTILEQEATSVERLGHDETATSMRHQLDRMRRQVDYHLAQARAAASGRGPGARCSIRESAEGLARALSRLSADKGVSIRIDVPPESTAAVVREDLDEMLGNLLDNACKWARSHVAVTASTAGGRVAITIDDDGKGLPAEMREAVLQRGVKADEAAPGSGLGLAIVRDVAEIYGGTLALETSPLGGLRATLTLPTAG